MIDSDGNEAAADSTIDANDAYDAGDADDADDADEARASISQIAKPVSKKRSKRVTSKPMLFNVTHTKYPVVSEVGHALGMEVATDDQFDATHLFWHDLAPSLDFFSRLKNYQRLNHFPSTEQITRKDGLARNLNRMAKFFPAEYGFYPRSWLLPAQASALQQYADACTKRGKVPTFISKPVASAQGKGISLARSARAITCDDQLIVQEYLSRPFLIDGFKFDLRVYVLVTSCDPLRAFMYDDGLVRLSTTKYSSPSSANIDQLFMHLTNYSLNKFSDTYDESEADGEGSKRTIKWLNDWLKANGHDVDLLWENVADICNKTLFVAQPFMRHGYHVSRQSASSHGPCTERSTCFEVLGFDIFLNRKLQPFVIEVNRGPSFSCGSALDHTIKFGALSNAVEILNLRPSDRTKSVAARRRQAQDRLLGMPPAGSAGPVASGLKRSSGPAGAASAATDIAGDVPGDIAGDSVLVRQYRWEDKHAGGYRRIFPPVGPNERFIPTYLAIQAQCEALFREQISAGSSMVAGSVGADARDAEDKLVADVACGSPARLLSGAQAPRPANTGVNDVLRKCSPLLPPIRAPIVHPAETEQKRIVSSKFLPRAGGAVAQAAAGQSPGDTTDAGMGIFARDLMLVRFVSPHHTEAEARNAIADMRDAWPAAAVGLANYWLGFLDNQRRRRVFDVVRDKALVVMQRVWPRKAPRSLRANDLVGKVVDRLLWRQGLINSFEIAAHDWAAYESFLALGTLTPAEQDACMAVVKLCQDCALLVHCSQVADAAGAAPRSTPSAALDSSVAMRDSDSDRSPDCASASALGRPQQRLLALAANVSAVGAVGAQEDARRAPSAPRRQTFSFDLLPPGPPQTLSAMRSHAPRAAQCAPTSGPGKQRFLS